MVHFFADYENITPGTITLTGDNFEHAYRVLRLRPGEEVVISDPSGKDYYCTVSHADEASGSLLLSISRTAEENHELPARVTLYQSLPKSDKMVFIIQKAVELGAASVVPVKSRNCVMKLGPENTDKKIARYRAVAEAAAKQSKRSIIPEVRLPLSFVDAVKEAQGHSDIAIIPYECAEGMLAMCESILNFRPGASIAVFIGPEGGYDPMEVTYAKNHGVIPVSLGKRILRAETAAVAVLSLIMIRVEIASEPGLLEK